MTTMANPKIGYHWIDGTTDGTGTLAASVNPATGATLGQFADADAATVDRAIGAARRAFVDSSWKYDRGLRARVLNAMADRFEQQMDALIASLTAENGKLAGEAAFEISTAAPKLRYWAAMTLTQTGRAGEIAPGRLSMVLRQPIGVVGVIVPWNAPVALTIRSLAPALAAGTTVVVKLPGQTGLTNALMAEIIGGTPELPPGVINLFSETGNAGAQALVAHAQVPAISFTGSSRTGRAIAAAAAPGLKRLSLELGGKTPMIVFDDANLDAAAFVAMKAITTFAGQFCMAGSRILVENSAYEGLVARLVPLMSSVVVGDGADPDSQMGPLIDKANVARVEALVSAAIDEGARPLVRGGPVEGEGAFYQPTLLEADGPLTALLREELFGPVLVLQRFETEAEAIALANDSDYGLAASVWSQDAHRPLRVARELEAGTVWLNNWALVYDECEEGGVKQSGLGRLNGPSALDTFLEYKHIAMDVGRVTP